MTTNAAIAGRFSDLAWGQFGGQDRFRKRQGRRAILILSINGKNTWV